MTGTTRRVQPSVPSASSSVCNHMVALVFGRTCTGDARRYVKRTPNFICLSGERKSHSACLQGGIWGFGHEGKQAAEAIRARFADATLVVVPPEVEGDETLLKALLPLTDVMAAGHHAAVSANVQAGARVAVIGDGAVGLCASLAIHRLGAEPTIARQSFGISSAIVVRLLTTVATIAIAPTSETPMAANRPFFACCLGTDRSSQRTPRLRLSAQK